MHHHVSSGLWLTRYRAYDSQTARWLSRDPIEEEGGVNLYGYVGGNPLSYTDPRGLNPVAGAIAGAEVGTAVFPGPGTIIGAGVGLLGGYLIADQFGNLIFAKPKPGSKPKGCPTGTKPIDQIPGLDKDDVHGIKDGVGAGPRDWTGIAPNGDVITGDGNGDAVNHGPYRDYLP
ncbi:RHS repeat-associated core domain-containing protein [Parazoarcus communis]